MKIEIIDVAQSAKPGKARYRTAQIDGRKIRVRVVDADSPTFGLDFEAAFKANVRRVRRENRQIKTEA
jgi:hypothetical protein